MPSACTKPENKTSPEVTNPVSQCITIVEKKVRNLEKRKGRLDGYREKQKSGVILNPDQAEAITKYDTVVQNLEFAKELQKQFQTISTELEKAMKKKAKREKIERQEREISRIREVLKLQELLSNMGAEEVREDFKKGSKGAVVLTEENLEQLDELYKLITPTREGETAYAEQLTRASEHIVNFLDGREKSVTGTTYKQLKEMVDKINDCGYFDNINNTEQEAKTEPETAGTADQHQSAAEPEVTAPAEPVKPAAEQEAARPQPEVVSSVSDQVQAGTTPSTMPCTMSASRSEASTTYRDDSFFSTSQYVHQRRDLHEIVSSVQGNFNFLQESEIDVDSPHTVDPAVVAARPMSTSLRTQDTTIQQSGYQNPSLLGSDDQTASAAANYSQQVSAPSSQGVISHHAAAQPVMQHVVSDSLDFGAASTPTVAESMQQSNTSQIQFGAVDAMSLDPQSSSSLAGGNTQQQVVQLDAYEQTYSPNLMSQTLGGSTSSQHVSFGDQSASSLMSSHMSSLQDQSASASSQNAPPPPQPMALPNQSLTGQSLMNQAFGATNSENTANQPKEKKPYTMNPNADPFQSATMFNQGEIGSMSSQTSSNLPQASNMMTQEDQRKQAWQTPVTQSQQTSQLDNSDYNNTGFSGSNQFGRNSGGARGGGRGSARGSRGVNNGFPRGSSRGGSSYSISRNGGFSNNRGGNRGGSAWQGYTSRSDYRPEAGYQGYNNNFSAGGMRGVPPRGGIRGNRGGAGGFNRNQPYPQQV